MIIFVEAGATQFQALLASFGFGLVNVMCPGNLPDFCEADG